MPSQSINWLKYVLTKELYFVKTVMNPGRSLPMQCPFLSLNSASMYSF